jgi:hypothetical protein
VDNGLLTAVNTNACFTSHLTYRVCIHTMNTHSRCQDTSTVYSSIRHLEAAKGAAVSFVVENSVYPRRNIQLLANEIEDCLWLLTLLSGQLLIATVKINDGVPGLRRKLYSMATACWTIFNIVRYGASCRNLGLVLMKSMIPHERLGLLVAKQGHKYTPDTSL